MKLTMIAAKPDEIELTLNVTMSLAKWREVRAELSGSSRSPIWELHRKIRDTIAEVESRFEVKRSESE